MIGHPTGYGVRVTGEQSQATVFERGSNVHEYWLAHAEGFHVASRRKPRDRIDHVVVDRRLGSATALVVRRKRGRRPKHIPVMWVSAVDPFERVVYLTPKRRVNTAAERMRPHVVDATRTARRAQHSALEWLRLRALVVVGALQRACVRAAIWLRPRLVEAGRRLTIAAARGYRGSCAFSLTVVRETNRRSLAAYVWLLPRVVTAARRAAHAVRSGAALRHRFGSKKPAAGDSRGSPDCG